jgi:O-antigen/teichoic acid export membrane protein
VGLAAMRGAGSRMIQLREAKAFIGPKLGHVIHFLAKQGITMAGNLLYGFLCVRLLPVADYAKFVVVFGIQGTLVVLMDVGISGSLIPLVGDRIEDRQLIADYLASLRQLAHWLFAIMTPITVIFYPLLVRNRQWSWQVVASMVAILLFSIWFARVAAAYSSVLIIRRDRGRWYRAQMVSSLGTLALLVVFWALHWLNAFSAILINVAGILSIAITYFMRARSLLGVAGVATKEKRTAIIQLTLPATPGVIFYALQGQISLLLITIFGHTAAVASVGALGRLAQVFTLFLQMNPLLEEPYFAKLPRNRLKRDYLGVVALAGGVGIAFIVLAWIFPQMFLWILGPKYAGLHVEVLLVMIGSAFRLVAGVAAAINGSRRFNYWWHNISTIVLTLFVQGFFLWKTDLGSIRVALWFGVASSAASMLVNLLCAVYGFVWGPRRVAGLDSIPERI